EVIETDVIASLGAPAQAVDPPVISTRPDRIPVIKRSAPALAGGAEGVRRDTGNSLWFEIVLQAKKFAVRPHVSTVISHKDGNIAHHPDGTLSAVTPQGMPLRVKEELNHAAKVRLGVQIFAGRGQDRNLAAGQAARPLLPASPVIAFAQHIEQDKVFQPPCISGTKALKAGAGAAPGDLQEGPGG